MRTITLHVETVEVDGGVYGWDTLPVLKANGKEIWRGKENLHYRNPEDQAIEVVIDKLRDLLSDD